MCSFFFSNDCRKLYSLNRVHVELDAGARAIQYDEHDQPNRHENRITLFFFNTTIISHAYRNGCRNRWEKSPKSAETSSAKYLVRTYTHIFQCTTTAAVYVSRTKPPRYTLQYKNVCEALIQCYDIIILSFIGIVHIRLTGLGLWASGARVSRWCGGRDDQAE